MTMSEETSRRLHAELVKLGDMIGDGLHLQPGGRWIARDYAKVAKELGYTMPRSSRVADIDKAMASLLQTTSCPDCMGTLKQTRSGSRRVECTDCQRRYQFRKPPRRKRTVATTQ